MQESHLCYFAILSSDGEGENVLEERGSEKREMSKYSHISVSSFVMQRRPPFLTDRKLFSDIYPIIHLFWGHRFLHAQYWETFDLKA